MRMIPGAWRLCAAAMMLGVSSGASAADDSLKEIQAQIKHEEWNEYVVIAKGNHLQHFINGVPTVDVIDEHETKAAKSGVLALQIHTGPPMTVQFKNLRLKNLGK